MPYTMADWLREHLEMRARIPMPDGTYTEIWLPIDAPDGLPSWLYERVIPGDEARTIAAALGDAPDEARAAQLLALVKRLAAFDDDRANDGAFQCHWCGAMYDGIMDTPTPHTPDCPVMQARALLRGH